MRIYICGVMKWAERVDTNRGVGKEGKKGRSPVGVFGRIWKIDPQSNAKRSKNQSLNLAYNSQINQWIFWNIISWLDNTGTWPVFKKSDLW